MAETSRSQVTITLGGSGQVVKREGAVMNREFSDPVPAVGSKRSVRDRLGSSADMQIDNKRQCGDNGRLTFNPSNSMDDFPLSKDDLRFKIMKRTQPNNHQNIDLRDMLSRRARSSTTSQSQRVPPETRDERRRVPDPRDNLVNLRMPPRTDRQQNMSHPQDERQQRVPQKLTGQFSSMRTSEGGHSSHRGILGNSYSPWTLDHIRRKSPPDRVLSSSRGLSPPLRRIEEPQRRMVTREYVNENSRMENSRSVSGYGGEISRPIGMSTSSYMAKTSIPVGPTKSMGPLVAPPVLPPGSTMQRSQYPVQEHVTVEGFLRSLGLEKYLISFKVEEVDMAALSQMGDHDLKELGIPMGPRKKILLALIARTRRQAR